MMYKLIYSDDLADCTVEICINNVIIEYAVDIA